MSVEESTERVVQVTGVGSMPGTDPVEATRIVAGELDVPHLPELPARGPGADMLGRTLALVAATTGEFAAETTPTGWRLAGGRAGAAPGRSMRLGSAWLDEDCDRLEEALAGFSGTVKVQLTGPWTLAAGLEAPRGTRVLADPGACAELAQALGESAAAHMTSMRKRVPGATVIAQLDEPTLPAVAAGRIRTASGRGTLRTPEPAELTALLGGVREAALAGGAADVLAHCCASTIPFDVLTRSGFSTLSLDLSAVEDRADEELGGWWDRGGRLVLGVVPGRDPSPRHGFERSEKGADAPGPRHPGFERSEKGADAPGPRHPGFERSEKGADAPGPGSTPDLARRDQPESVARSVDALWRRIGFGVADVGERTWLSPSCGLAGASPAWSRGYGAVLRRAAGLLQSA